VEADANELLPSTLLLYYSIIELTFELTFELIFELTFEDVYLWRLTRMKMLPSTSLLHYSTIELTFELTSELIFEDVYLWRLTQMKMLPSTLLQPIPLEVTFRKLFQSSKLKARMSLLPRYNKKRRSSFEL